jgi:hypothetical protein
MRDSIAAPDNTAAAKAVAAARQAVNSKQLGQLASFVPQAKGDVLASYPEYWFLRTQLGLYRTPSVSQSLEQFLEKNSGAYLADRLRGEWVLTAARSGDFVSLQIHEFIGWHIVRQDKRTMGFEYDREDDAMKYNIVFANEMDQSCVVTFPIVFPVFAVLVGPHFGIGNVADGRIEPHIQDFAICTSQRYRNAPIQIPRHCPALQAAIDPTHALTYHMRLPFFAVMMLHSVQFTFLDVFADPSFVMCHWQEPMRSFF